MALEAGERGRLSLLQRSRPLAMRTRAADENDQTTPNSGVDSVRARGLTLLERRHDNRVAVDSLPGYEHKPPMHDRNIVDELRSRLRRQDALVFAVGLLLLAMAAMAVIYVYWDNGQPFESTSDAFIARRQFPTVVRAILPP
jgi:hypothetical protein